MKKVRQQRGSVLRSKLKFKMTIPHETAKYKLSTRTHATKCATYFALFWYTLSPAFRSRIQVDTLAEAVSLACRRLARDAHSFDVGTTQSACSVAVTHLRASGKSVDFSASPGCEILKKSERIIRKCTDASTTVASYTLGIHVLKYWLPLTETR